MGMGGEVTDVDIVLQLSFCWAVDFLLHFRRAEAAGRTGIQLSQGTVAIAGAICWKKPRVGFLN